jgi:hypothetical protein
MSDEDEEERRMMREILKIIENNEKNFCIDIDKKIETCSNNEIKKKIFEFTIENLYLKFYKNSDLNIKLNEVNFARVKRNEELLKKENDEYVKKRKEFSEYIYVKYILLFFQLYKEVCQKLQISSDSDVEYLELEKFNQQDNEKKNYILCSCFFDAFTNNKGAIHNIGLNDKINKLSQYVFTRNDYYRENFDKFKSFNIKQIKQILDLMGPEKCVLIQEKIFKQITNGKIKYDLHSHIEEICRNKIRSFYNVTNGIRSIEEKTEYFEDMERIYLNIICRKEYTFLFKDVVKMNIKKSRILTFIEALKADDFFMKDEFVERLRLTFIENDEKSLRSDIKSFIDDKFKEIQKFKPSMLYNNEIISLNIYYMISSFISIFNKILSQIYISNDVKKNIFEFTIQYMYEEIYLKRSYSYQTLLFYESEKVINGNKISDEDIIKSFNNQKKLFTDGIDIKINYLMSEYLKLAKNLENKLPFSEENNEQKNYTLTVCIFGIFDSILISSEDFEDHKKDFEGFKNEIDEIDKMKLSLFTRIDIQICQDDVKNEIQDYCSNIKFELLNIDQIKEILDLIGPEKCVRTHEKILEKIADDKSKYVNVYLHIEKQIYGFVMDRNKDVLKIIQQEVTRKEINHLTDTIINIYKKFIYIKEVEKYRFTNKLFGKIVIPENSFEIKKNILDLISKLDNFDFDHKRDFFELVRNLFKITDKDVSELLFSDDEPKKKLKKKKSKKDISEEVTDEIIDSATKATDIECSTIDDEKKGKILSAMNDEIIKKIRSEFFYEKDKKDEKGVVIFCNDDLKNNPSYPKDYYSLIIFNFIKPYLLFIISFILKNNDEFKKNNLNVILWGGACVQFFSKGKRRASDLDFKIYSNKNYDVIKEVLEKEMFPYLLSILDIKQILRNTVPIFNEGTHSDYQTNIINAIKQLVDDDANIELKFEYYEERHIIKFNANVLKNSSSYKISLIDISLNILKGGITLPRTNTIKIDDGVEIKIITKSEMIENLSNYKSDYENLNKIKEYVESIMKSETSKTDNKKSIKKKMRKERIKEEDITHLFNFVEKEEEKDLTQGEIVEKMLTNDDEKHKKELNYFLPKYINKVPSINFTKTIEFLGKKAIDQLNAIKEEAIKIEEIDEEDGRRIVRKRSLRRKSIARKKSVKRKRSVRKSVRRRSIVRKKSVKKIRN